MDEQKCPYCNRMHFIPDVVYKNIESYGPSVVRFRCNHCGKVVKSYATVTVNFSICQKTNEESDWG